jgi:hypothetical protein
MLLITLIMTFMAASASFHTGIGKTHMRGILPVINIPGMSRSSWKTRER